MVRNNILLLATIITVNSWSQDVVLKGFVGTYPIEMTLRSSDKEKGLIEGEYNYKGKKNHLTLKGELLDGVIYMKEFYDGNQTGTFYLNHNDDTLFGTWVNNPKWFDVGLVIKSGNLNELYPKTVEVYAENTSSTVTGGYVYERYFINDMWFQENKPELEVGFNGGHAIIHELSPDSIEYTVEVICGPTYHFAFASGVAVRNGDRYIHEYDEGCTIYISFKNKDVLIESEDTGYACGFGARAYLSHTLTKVTDEYQFGEEVSIDQLKGIAE